MMFTRIGTRVILATGISTAVIIGAMAFVIVQAHRADLVRELTRSANQLSETVKSSTYYDMLENRRDDLHRQIVTIGRQDGIEKVRLFNKEGRIMFSSDSEEIGRWVDKQAEACYACHAIDEPLSKLPISARSRTFRSAGGDRVLGIVSPIDNQPSCYTASCHAHSSTDTVLGVLDVNLSLAEVDEEIADSQGRMVILAVLAIAVSSLILWWLNRQLVLRPVHALRAGTQRVAEGDLTTTIPVTADHELGDLARAFNEMTGRLAEAQRQLAQADKLASVGRLAAGVAHEINNPLTGVLTYSSFLLKRVKNNPDLQGDLQVIVRETKRCREIVKGMLDFARPAPPRRQATNLNEVVRRAVAMMMNELSLHHVSLDLNLNEELPRVSADPNQMQQVVVNLLVNATDAIGEGGGSIHLATTRTLLPPWGYAPVRRATCPKGHDLLDPIVRIGGLPAIRVNRKCGGREAPFHLDPVYGRFNHVEAVPCQEGVEGTFTCPRCRIDLSMPESRCQRCSAPTFAVQTPKEGRVLWCARNECHWSRWEAREERGRQAVIELFVEDTGRGIAESDLPYLFEPFFTTKGSRGMGLGLAISWGIIDAHGGTIDVSSTLGQGSRFVIRLPLDSSESGVTTEVEKTPVGTHHG